jgi:hypothetical protein
MTEREQLEKLLTEKAAIKPEDLVPFRTFGSRNKIYDACNAQEIECFRHGKSIIIPTAPLRRKLGLEPVRAA